MKKLMQFFLAAFLIVSLFSSKNTPAYAQCESSNGCFDCQWRNIGGGSACRAVNQTCVSGYIIDADRCGQLTPQGRDVCEEIGNQDIRCVEESGSTACTGTSSGLSGTCYTATLCPGTHFEDGAYPDVCPPGGRCCVPNLAPTPTLPTGGCCTPPRTYNTSRGECCSPVPGSCRPTNCSSSEACHQTSDGAGICQPDTIPTPTGGPGPSPNTCEARNILTFCTIMNNNCGRGTTAIPNSSCTACSCQASDHDIWGTCVENEEIRTALGCIPVNPTDLGAWFIARALGVAGGIAFLLMVYAGFIIAMASGNPARLQAGKELLTSAISGLLLIIFSLFLLNLIGVSIFQIPGF